MTSDRFSSDFFVKALHDHIKKNADVLTASQAMNSYYRSVVSSIIHDQLNKNFELVRRIKNLDEAYNQVKSSLK